MIILTTARLMVRTVDAGHGRSKTPIRAGLMARIAASLMRRWARDQHHAATV